MRLFGTSRSPFCLLVGGRGCSLGSARTCYVVNPGNECPGFWACRSQFLLCQPTFGFNVPFIKFTLSIAFILIVLIRYLTLIGCLYEESNRRTLSSNALQSISCRRYSCPIGRSRAEDLRHDWHAWKRPN